MESTDVDICYLLHQRMCFCISSLVKSIVIGPEKLQSNVEWLCYHGKGSNSLLDMCVQLPFMYRHQKEVPDPLGSTRWHTWQEHNRCKCVPIHSSELPFCFSNWSFAENTNICAMKIVSEQEAMMCVPRTDLTGAKCLEQYSGIKDGGKDSHSARLQGNLVSYRTSANCTTCSFFWFNRGMMLLRVKRQ